MITVGLVKELLFISTVLNQKVEITFNKPFAGLTAVVDNNFLSVYYEDNFIWREEIEGETAFFGIESCDAISRIVACINDNNPNWNNYSYIQVDK